MKMHSTSFCATLEVTVKAKYQSILKAHGQGLKNHFFFVGTNEHRALVRSLWVCAHRSSIVMSHSCFLCVLSIHCMVHSIMVGEDVSIQVIVIELHASVTMSGNRAWATDCLICHVIFLQARQLSHLLSNRTQYNQARSV